MRAVTDFLHRNGRWIGVAVSLMALAAFTRAFAGVMSLQETGVLLERYWAALLSALALYLMAYIPMSFGWQVLARSSGATIGRLPLLEIFLISQTGKYLPGNVGHLIGRACLAHGRGMPLKVSGIAMTLEMIGVLAAAALFAALAGLLSPGLGGHSAVPLTAAGVALVMLTVFLLLSRRRIADPRALLASMAVALACYLAVFALLATAHIVLLGAFSWGIALHVAGAVVLSWLVGFMVPGAPAGLGLRELSFYTLLVGTYPDESLLFTAAGMRLATIAGDGIACLVGLGLARGYKRASPAIG